MTEHTKNLAVGLTVIVALVLLGSMIVLFTGLPTLFQRGYRIDIRLPSRAETNPGDEIHISGEKVGRITGIDFTDPDDPYKGVTLTARINRNIRLPGNTAAFVYKRPFMGGAYTELKPEGPLPTDPATGSPVTFLQPDTEIVIPGRVITPSMLPDDLEPALKGLAKLAENLNNLIAPPPPAQGTTTASAPAPGTPLARSISNLNAALEGLAKVFGDVENQANWKTSLANLGKATERADKAMEAMRRFADEARKTSTTAGKRIDQLTGKLIEDAEKISRLLATVNRAAMKLEAGEGTAGRLISDPKLYNNLVELSQQMKVLLGELSQLVKTWKEKGVKIKM